MAEHRMERGMDGLGDYVLSQYRAEERIASGLSAVLGMTVKIIIFHSSNGRRKAWVYVNHEQMEVDAECPDITLYRRILTRLERYHSK